MASSTAATGSTGIYFVLLPDKTDVKTANAAPWVSISALSATVGCDLSIVEETTPDDVASSAHTPPHADT
jgi:hypothetical protein